MLGQTLENGRRIEELLCEMGSRIVGVSPGAGPAARPRQPRRLRTSPFELRTSDFGLRTSDFGLRTSDVRTSTSTSDFGLRTSGLRTSDFGLRTSDFGLRTSSTHGRLRAQFVTRSPGFVTVVSPICHRSSRHKPLIFRGCHRVTVQTPPNISSPLRDPTNQPGVWRRNSRPRRVVLSASE